MSGKKSRINVFEAKRFGLIIGLLILFLVFLLSSFTRIPENLRTKMLDVFFMLKTSEIGRNMNLQVGVVSDAGNIKVSEDILIVGIDSASLNKFGKWPFPRYRHANLFESLSRIKNENERERAVFLDVMLNEPDADATNDAILLDAIRENGKVLFEITLNIYSMGSEANTEYQRRFEALVGKLGELTSVKGPWMEMDPYFASETPLMPYAKEIQGYGHADFLQDSDGVYRNLPVISRYSLLKEEIRLEDLDVSMNPGSDSYEYLMWTDKENFQHYEYFPLTETKIKKLSEKIRKEAPLKVVDADNDGKPDQSYHVLSHYSDQFIPSISLMLALNYFNKTLNDIEVVLGKYIRIPTPQHFNTETGEWGDYQIVVNPPLYDKDNNLIRPARMRNVPEIRIPIDKRGNMLINFMGSRSSESHEGYQTFRIRPFHGYTSSVPSPDPSTWPRTKALGNKIVLVGAFARGIASDEKTTPYGLMYGVEIHANALNTIIMDNFLMPLPDWLNVLILVCLVMLTAFMASRMSTILSMIVTLILVFMFFMTSALVFDFMNIVIDFPVTTIAFGFTFLSVVVYRVVTEEKDKKRIRDMFGKYVSPSVVDQILSAPPELGGVDKELSVFFSDIRGFTTLSENMTPQELVNHLNIYFTAMTDIIMEYQGTLDKYVGDEIMCFWGAPLPQPEHALLACKCALKQMKVLGELNAGWPDTKRINIGIGVNSGIMTVGNMGSQGRMNYTLMGDNVNLGARLEGTNKQYKTNIIISEYTYGLVKNKIIARELDNIRVKGKNKPVFIYELIDVIEGLEPGFTIKGSGSKVKNKYAGRMEDSSRKSKVKV